MQENWWAEWEYEADELSRLTDPRWREAGHCQIGPSGIRWSGQSNQPDQSNQASLLIEFERLTAVEVITVSGSPSHLRFEWRKNRNYTVISGIPILSEILALIALFSFISRLWEVPSEVVLPIPRRYQAEIPALVERFEKFIKAPQQVMRQALLFSIVLTILIIALVFWLSLRR